MTFNFSSSLETIMSISLTPITIGLWLAQHEFMFPKTAKMFRLEASAFLHVEEEFFMFFIFFFFIFFFRLL